jgi:rhodanese-related sulfurtransferase
MNANLELVANSPVFSTLTIEQQAHALSEHVGALEGIDAVFGNMETVTVYAGEEVVRHRDRGDRYYIIREGEAEVWKPDPETDVWSCVDRLGPGDAFGEDAILVGGYRNATVRMITDGTLLMLDEHVFNNMLRNHLVEEVTPGQAREKAGQVNHEWLDCRFEIEYSEGRIPGARLIPLHTLRHSLHELDRGKHYLVYCRSGRRSVCATYLLRERGFNAVSVKGGVLEWPYALESDT